MDPKHEVDVEGESDDEPSKPDCLPTHEGYLLKGPEGLISEKMFANIATKSFKRRFCKLRQEGPTGSFFLDVCSKEDGGKNSSKVEVAVSICLDECEEVLANKRRNKFMGFQLRLASQKSYVFAAGSEAELDVWLDKLSLAVHSSKSARVSPDIGNCLLLYATCEALNRFSP